MSFLTVAVLTGLDSELAVLDVCLRCGAIVLNHAHEVHDEHHAATLFDIPPSADVGSPPMNGHPDSYSGGAGGSRAAESLQPPSEPGTVSHEADVLAKQAAEFDHVLSTIEKRLGFSNPPDTVRATPGPTRSELGSRFMATGHRIGACLERLGRIADAL